jgi:hypothetical protein
MTTRRYDPVVRARLKDLLAACPALREEIKRRSNTAEAAEPVRQSRVDLLTARFGATA